MFHPALTTCASERMKTQRFSYFAGFAARERMREAKPVKARKSGVQPLFRLSEHPFRDAFSCAGTRFALRGMGRSRRNRPKRLPGKKPRRYGGHWDDAQVGKLKSTAQYDTGKLCHSQHNQARQRPLSPLRARNPIGRGSRRSSAPVRVPCGIPAPCRAAALSRRAHFTPSPLYFRGIFDTIPMLRQPGGKVNFSC